ncbi:MAG TPA: cytochrome o ubiquinol oxidase subunit IV [Patescibacteria group bacterium]|nr:cytochrome o ubiquinol oxidase subunit IV [Patescibacteria group bacterium]
MAERELVVRNIGREPGTVRSYTIGFVSAVALTLIAFGVAGKHSLHGNKLIAVLLGLALVQFVLQLVFFLHVGRESKPRWKQLVLIMMLVVVLILVLGSIWVMYSLNYRMTPQQINTYIQKQDGGI